MANNPDWMAIRAEYEQGATLRALAAKHGISKSAIGKKKSQEQWSEKVDSGHVPPIVHSNVHSVVSRLPKTYDVLSIADLLLSQLAHNLQLDMDIRDIKLASDALASCAKVKLTYPAEQEEQDINDGIVLWPEKLLPETRLEIRRLLEADEQQQQREERVS